MEMNDKNNSRSGASAGQVALLMLLSAVISAVLVIALLALGTTRYKLVDSTRSRSTALLTELLSNVSKYYYFSDDAPSEEELTDAAAHALVNAVGDPYAAYYSEEEYESFRDSMNGNYKGIGVLIQADPERGTLVERVYEETPAETAGLLAGDIITAVDGQSVVGLDANQVSALIMGEDGTIVSLTILRGEETLSLPVTRGDVYVRRVYTQLLENSIGYLRMDSFTGNVVDEFNAGLDKLLADGVTALIIDVRNNPGGTLDSVVAIADRILPDCIITTLEGKLVDPPQVYRSSDAQKLEIPLVVLTNGNSASASEIFASAVQDNAAGLILGTTTFGKGIVQTSWEVLPGQGYLKLTTDAYLTPKGSMIHGVGITPDRIVEQDPELESTDVFFILRDMPERDLQLNAAIEYLNGVDR